MPPVWFALSGDSLRGFSVNCLESAAHAEAKDALFLVEEEWKPINHLVATRVGIISIDKAKRHVENRYLEANLGAHAAANVAELREQTLVEAHDGVRLSIATQKNRIETKGKTRKRIGRTPRTRRLIELRLRCQTVVACDQGAKKRRKCQVREGVTASGQRRKTHGGYLRARNARTRNEADARQEWLVRKKFTRVTLFAFSAEIESRSRIYIQRRAYRSADDRNSIFEISEHLRVGAGGRVGARQLSNVVSTCASECSDVCQRLIKARHGNWRPANVGRNHHITRSDEVVERRDWTDRSDVVTANGEFITQKEPFVNRHTVDKCERVRVPHLRRRSKASDGPQQNSEAKNFRMIGPLVAYGNKLCELQRRFIGAHIAAQPGDA